MKFFSKNIGTRGRVVRATAGVALVVAAAFTFSASRWIAIPLGISGVFVLFEAFRGWCLLRACGIKTRL
jgi:uncharacterized membrane protein